jgi:hypothetical protein
MTDHLSVAGTGPAGSGGPGATAADRLSYVDLGATVHRDGNLADVPADVLAELPSLYGSPFSTAEYFAIYDRPRRVSVCELREPRHVVVFAPHGATADVLNKVAAIEPAAFERVVAAIFRAHPELRRIRAEIKFPPHELTRPLRQTYRSDDQVIELPADPSAWESRLGASTRKHLHRYRNGLRRKYPAFRLDTLEGGAITLPLVEQTLEWNRQRISAKGDSWMFADDQEATADRLWRLLQGHGVALCGHVGDERVATHLRLFVGDDCWAHTGGFDPAYADVHLGMLMTSFSICDAITRGSARFHLTWGTVEYKQHLGAAPVTAYRVSVYRSRLDRALYARERWALLVRDRRDLYWRARGALKRRLKAMGGSKLALRQAARPTTGGMDRAGD